jgi:hypothetical protein
MGSLSDYFKTSGYAVHRSALRPERLPECCRNALADVGRAIRYLDSYGKEIWVPIKRCGVCGRCYAVCEGKYMPIDNPLKYETVNLSE